MSRRWILIKRIPKKLFIFILIIVATLLPLIFVVLLFNPPQFQNLDVPLLFDGDDTYLIVKDQINLNLTHYRTPGTNGREDCAAYFINKFKEIDNDFTYLIHNFSVLSIDCQNIVFKLNEHLTNIVILAAHYDSRAKATKDPNLSLRNEPVPGANDGASGCGALIELAKVLYSKRSDLACQIWFLFFDAEDQGYDYGAGIPGWNWSEGSSRFVDSLESFYGSTKDFDCMILLDMIGGFNLQFINEQHSTSSLLQEIFEIGRQLGFNQAFPINPLSATITDDHVPFVEKGIPSADLIINFWNNPSWPYHHTTQDNLSHISNSSLEITGKTVEQFIYNNYLDIPQNNYRGNYPWKDDINFLDTDILVILIITGLILGFLALSYVGFKKFRNPNEERDKNNVIAIIF